MQINRNFAAAFDKAVVILNAQSEPESRGKCIDFAYECAVEFCPSLKSAPSAHRFQRDRVVKVASRIYLEVQ